MTMGFRELSAPFFAEVLSRKLHQAVRVRKVQVMSYSGPPEAVRRPVGLHRVDLETTVGPLRLVVKSMAQARSREAAVWRFLEKAGGLPLPEVYHVEHDTRQGQHGVILEYIPPTAGVQEWDDRLCRLAAAALAQLHGRFWARDSSLPDLFEPPETASHATVEPGVRRFLDRMSPERQMILYSVVPEVLTFMARLLRMGPRFYREGRDLPRTLIHGALDVSEVLFRPRGANLEAVLIDWEHARIGRPIEDLSSLISSLPLERWKASRAVLVPAYLDALRALEVALPTGRLEGELDRQRILLAARELPRLCAMYLERRDDPAQQAWCKWFLAMAAKDVVELGRVLDELNEVQAQPERT